MGGVKEVISQHCSLLPWHGVTVLGGDMTKFSFTLLKTQKYHTHTQTTLKEAYQGCKVKSLESRSEALICPLVYSE